MSRYETIRATPPNIEELEGMARDKSSWRIRLFAIEELRKWNCKRSRDTLFKLAESDAIHEVRIQAIRALEVFGDAVDYDGVSVPGEETYRHRLSRAFKRVCSEEAGGEASKVMELLKEYDPELYDIMEYYKNDKFEEWLIQECKNIRRRQIK